MKSAETQKSEVLTSSQYYGIGAVLAVGVIGSLSYYIYQAKKGEVPPQYSQPPQQPPKANKFKMD